MGSVAASPRHPVPSISSTSCTVYRLVHKRWLRVKSSRNEVYTCTLCCHWCMRVNVCWREQKGIGKESKWSGANKKGTEKCVAQLYSNLVYRIKINEYSRYLGYYFRLKNQLIVKKGIGHQELCTKVSNLVGYCMNCFNQNFWYFPSGRDTLIFPVSSLVAYFFNMLGSWVTKGYCLCE